MSGGRLDLRDYQTRAVLSVLSDEEPVLVISPPGSGKTKIAEELVRRYSGEALCIAPRREIVEQLRERTGAAAVTVQSLLSNPWRSIAPKLLVLDECHHYRDGNEFERVLEQFPESRIVGLSATPTPDISKAFRRIVVGAQYSELVEAGHLVEAEVFQPSDVQEGAVAMSPVLAYERFGNNGRGFLFAPTLELSRAWVEGFRAIGITSAHVDGTTPTSERDRIVEEFKAGEIRILSNYDIFTEGVDVPEASVCILARKFGTEGAFLQATGRVLRPHASKERARIIDLTGATFRHGWPTDDREYELGSDVKRKEKLPPLRVCPRCGNTQLSKFQRCARCNFLFLVADPRVIKIRNEELQEARRVRSSPEDRDLWLRDKIDDCIRSGFSLYKAGAEFRERFGLLAPLGKLTTPQEQRNELGLLRSKHGSGKAWAIARKMFSS